MVDLCRGSGGVPNPIFGNVVTSGFAALGEFLLAKLSRERAAAMAAIIAGASWNLTQICSHNAPDPPTLTDQDWNDALSPPNPAAYIVALGHIKDWFLSQYWCVLCQCGDNGPCVAPAAPIPPNVGQNSGLPDTGGNNPCSDVTNTSTIDPGAAISTLLSPWLPATQLVNVTSSAGSTATQAYLLPAGVGFIHEYYTVGVSPGSTTSPTFQLEAFGSTGASLGIIGGFGCTNCQFDRVVTLPPGSTSWAILEHNANPAPIPYTYRLQMFCNGNGPTTVPSDCCPSDPNIDIKLNQILQLLLSLPSAAAGGYARGTVHAGLTGQGSISASKLAGIEVAVTQGVPGRIVIGGNPPYQWDLGFLSMFDGGGMIQEQRLTRQHQIWLPASGVLANGWGYFLEPGVTITVTELVAT